MPDQVCFDFDLLRDYPLPALTEGGALLLAFDEARPGAVVIQARAAQRSGCRDVVVRAPSQVALQLALALPDARVVSGEVAPDVKFSAVALDARAEADAPANVATALRVTAASVPKANKKSSRLLLLDESAGLSADDVTNDVTKLARDANAPIVLPGVETLVALSSGTLHRIEGRQEVGAKDEPRGALLGAAGGDLLLGIAGALLARGLSPDGATLWTGSLYALCVEATAKDLGEDSLTTRDAVERISGALRFLKRAADTKKAAGGFGLLRG